MLHWLRRLLIVFRCNFRVLKSTVFSHCKVSTPKHCVSYIVSLSPPPLPSLSLLLIITLNSRFTCFSPITFAYFLCFFFQTSWVQRHNWCVNWLIKKLIILTLFNFFAWLVTSLMCLLVYFSCRFRYFYPALLVNESFTRDACCIHGLGPSSHAL